MSVFKRTVAVALIVAFLMLTGCGPGLQPGDPGAPWWW